MYKRHKSSNLAKSWLAKQSQLHGSSSKLGTTTASASAQLLLQSQSLLTLPSQSLLTSSVRVCFDCDGAGAAQLNSVCRVCCCSYQKKTLSVSNYVTHTDTHIHNTHTHTVTHKHIQRYTRGSRKVNKNLYACVWYQ